MPGRPSQTWHSRDTAKLGDMATAAFEVLGRCVHMSSTLNRYPGWKNVGMLPLIVWPPENSMIDELVVGFAQSIGVILWATDSVEDKRVPTSPSSTARPENH